MKKALSRRFRTKLALGTAPLAAAVLVLAGQAAIVPAHALTTKDVYMSTTGSDSNPGTSSQPVKTLKKARQLIVAVNTDEARIHVAPGTYFETEVIIWNNAPQSKIWVERTDSSSRPVFDGSSVPLTGTDSSGNSWDAGRHCWMRTGEGAPNSPALDVRGFTIQNYGTCGVRLYNVSGSTIRNDIFRNLGNKHVTGTSGYAAIHVTNSNNNSFINNTYSHLENDVSAGSMHAIYPSKSSGNTISDSEMEFITGDAVRLRDGASNNTITDNIFRNISVSMQAQRADVSFWRFLDSEVCGTGNTVSNNTWNGKYYGGQSGIPIFGNGAETDKGVTVCSPNPISGSSNVLDPNA